MVVSPHKCQKGAMVFNLVGIQSDDAEIFFLSPNPTIYLETVGFQQKEAYPLTNHRVATIEPA